MEKIKQHTLFIGLLDKDTKKRKVNKNKAKALVNKVLEDCTISDATGYYTHADGTHIVEPSLRVEMFFKQDAEVFNACEIIKRELNQESIALSVNYVDAMLV